MNEIKNLENLLNKAKSQFQRCCIPMIAAIVISVIISGTGIPMILMLATAAVGWAWWRGWRVSIRKPDKKSK